jgi:hypothetical protein
MMFEAAEPALRRRLGLLPRPAERSLLSPAEGVLFDLYARIVVMQVTIILGACFAMLIGTVGAYAFLVAVKTAIDVALEVFGSALHDAWLKAKASAEKSRT